MSTPRDFFLDPCDPSLRPSPFPPRYLKRQIYNDPAVFRQVDEHAVNEARTNYRNFRDLMWNLIFKKQWSELERARAIFRWMTTKNLYTLIFDSELPGSPEQVLGSFKDSKTTYARVFECLAIYAGLQCVTVSGWAKGVDYKPGMPITSSPQNHSWNAIYIDGNWQLVDCHWATRYLTSERKQIIKASENLVYEYDDFYFLTEPSMLIYSHCPEEPAWQLLHPARSRKVYEEYPLVKSFFFSTGMQFLQQNRGIVSTRKGVATLTLGYTQPTAFTFKVGYGDNSTENLQGIQLKRYVIQETTENRVTYYFRSPREGNFYLTIFSQPVADKVRLENVFKAACEYKLVCDQAASDIRPYPLCAEINWGAGIHVQQYGLQPTYKTALLAAPNGRAELAFKKTREVRVHARLVRDGMDDETLENAVKVKEQDNLALIAIALPTTGEYGLEIYANDPLRNGDTFTHVCQYLVSYADRDLGTMYGQVFDRADLAPGMQATAALYNTPTGLNTPLPHQGPTRGGPGDGSRRGTLDNMGRPSHSSSVRPHRVQDWDGSSVASSRYQEDLDPDSPRRRQTAKMTQGSVRKPKMSVDPGMPEGYLASKKLDDSPQKPLEIVYVSNIIEKIQGKKPSVKEEDLGPPVEVVYVSGNEKPRPKEADDDHLRPVEISYIHSSKTKGHNDSFDSSPTSSRRGGFGGNGHYIPGSENHNPSQEEWRHLTGRTHADRDSFPHQSHGHGFPGDKTSWLPLGYNPHHRNSTEHYNPNDFRRSPSIDIDRRNGYYRKPSSRLDYGPQSSQAPFDTQTVVPIYHVPYPLGKDNQNGFTSLVPVELEQEYKPHPQKLYMSSIAIQPPPSFRPIPIRDDDLAPRPAPPSVPPKPFKDTRVFENVDMHAVEVSKEDHKSFRDLVWHLIYAREITNELEKSRAIFLWLCSKDLAKLNFYNDHKGSPEEILMQLKSGLTTYAVVYEILCSYAGLHCKTITGYAKGAEYKPGMRFTGEQGQHSWNAVLVNGAWRLVDCHWAARRLVGKQVTVENIRYELDEYYFMPDPHQLIFTHFPDDINWQLLERPISLTDFENLVPVKSAFFKYGLQILGHREAVIHTKQEVTIRIGCPQFKAHSIAFTFTLAYSNGKEEYQGMKLNRFGMQEMIDNVSFFTIRPPEKASYRLIIYAKDLDQPSKEGVYGGVCEYELVCDDHPDHSQSFPPCVHTSWGPGDSISKYNLIPLQKGAIFSTVQGLAEVRFQMPKDLRFTAKLKSNDRDEKALAGFIMNRIVGDVAVFTVNAPVRGEYGLEVYANDPEIDGNSLYHAYQYLIICDEPVGMVEPLPSMPPGFLGPQPAFNRFGILAASHVDPYIQTDVGEIQIAITMSQQLLRVTSQLIYASYGHDDDSSDYVLQQSRGNLVVFFMKLTRPGLYKFQIYALPFHDVSENLPAVYNYLINCTETRATLVPYPRQYGQWKEGCYLFEPLDGHLQPTNSGSGPGFPVIYFRLDVPKANAVAVIIGEVWTQLELRHSGSWEGEINLDAHWGRESKVAVCANFTSSKSSSYSTLLEYSI